LKSEIIKKNLKVYNLGIDYSFNGKFINKEKNLGNYRFYSTTKCFK